MIKYGLRHKATGKLLGWNASASADAYNIHHHLSIGGNAWLVSHKALADNSRSGKMDGSYAFPEHIHKPDELEVVTIRMVITK